MMQSYGMMKSYGVMKSYGMMQLYGMVQLRYDAIWYDAIMRPGDSLMQYMVKMVLPDVRKS